MIEIPWKQFNQLSDRCTSFYYLTVFIWFTPTHTHNFLRKTKQSSISTYANARTLCVCVCNMMVMSWLSWHAITLYVGLGPWTIEPWRKKQKQKGNEVFFLSFFLPFQVGKEKHSFWKKKRGFKSGWYLFWLFFFSWYLPKNSRFREAWLIMFSGGVSKTSIIQANCSISFSPGKIG